MSSVTRWTILASFIALACSAEPEPDASPREAACAAAQDCHIACDDGDDTQACHGACESDLTFTQCDLSCWDVVVLADADKASECDGRSDCGRVCYGRCAGPDEVYGTGDDEC